MDTSKGLKSRQKSFLYSIAFFSMWANTIFYDRYMYLANHSFTVICRVPVKAKFANAYLFEGVLPPSVDIRDYSVSGNQLSLVTPDGVITLKRVKKINFNGIKIEKKVASFPLNGTLLRFIREISTKKDIVFLRANKFTVIIHTKTEGDLSIDLPSLEFEVSGRVIVEPGIPTVIREKNGYVIFVSPL